MANVFYDRIIDFQQYDINLNENIFEQILETRKTELDSERFFLRYISDEDVSKYDFNNKDSLREFRDIRYTCKSPIKRMAGCNLRAEMLEKGIRYAGIILSDPYKNVLGQFDVINDSMIYSPIFPFFYDERDLIKFANDVYFTTIPFDELVMNQMNYVKKFYVHVGNAMTTKELRKYGRFIFEEISKDQMIDYIKHPEQGEKVLKKYIAR